METDEALRTSAGLMDLQQSLALKALQESHDVLAQRVDSMAVELVQNTAATKRIEDNTSELVEIFVAMRGGFKVLGWIGGVGQKLAWVGVMLAAAYALWQAAVAWVKSGAPRP